MPNAPAADTAWWQQPLTREIALVLAVKIALIFALWWAFFDVPDTARVGAAQVSAHVAGIERPAPHHSQEMSK